MPRTTTSVTRRTWGPRKKYSLSRSTIGLTITPAADGTLGPPSQAIVVASITGQGKRKAKNFDIQLACQQGGDAVEAVIYYALVYVPSGSQPGVINATTGVEYYSPASNVLAAGIYDCDEGTGFRVRTRLARNLNAGDQILLLSRATAANTQAILLRGIVTYVVAYN